MDTKIEYILILTSAVSAVVSVLGAGVGIYLNFYHAKPNKKHTEATTIEAIAEGAESLAIGTKVSNEYLLLQIQQLIEKDKKREEEFKIKEAEWEQKIDRMAKQMIVSQRLIEEQRREIVDLYDWAERLTHQVFSLRGIPVPFKPDKMQDAETQVDD